MILVTGGTGMLGSFIVKELLRRSRQVRILVRPESAGLVQAPEVELALGDLSDVQSLRRAALGVTGIIHVACTFQNPPQVDIAAMQILLDAWDQGPFVFISSVDVYGYAQSLPITENHPFKSFSGYGKGKIRCEQLLEATTIQRGRSDFSVLRPPHIWGPHPRCLNHPASPVTPMYYRVRAGEAIFLPGKTVEEWSLYGDAWIDARELAWVSAECLASPISGAANAINSHFSWHEFFTELIHLSSSASQLVHSDRLGGFFGQPWKYSGERLERSLGFNPIYRWQETLAEMVALEPKR